MQGAGIRGMGLRAIIWSFISFKFKKEEEIYFNCVMREQSRTPEVFDFVPAHLSRMLGSPSSYLIFTNDNDETI